MNFSNMDTCYINESNENDDNWSKSTLFFGGILGSASRAEFPVCLSNHVGFTPILLYSSTHHSPECFIHLKTGWAQDAWLQWSYENWYFHLDISRWRNSTLIRINMTDLTRKSVAHIVDKDCCKYKSFWSTTFDIPGVRGSLKGASFPVCKIRHPTNRFTILEPHDQEIGENYVAHKRRVTDFEAPKLWKGSSGTMLFFIWYNWMIDRLSNE